MSQEIIENLDLRKKELEVEKLEKETKKLDIEQQKLLIEKAELTKKWYKKPQWWSVLVPLIIGTGTVWIAFSTGIISVQRLTNQKEDLEKNVKMLNQDIKTKNQILLEIYEKQVQVLHRTARIYKDANEETLSRNSQNEADELQKKIDSLKSN